MKLFVTGATGFTGSRLVPLLLQEEFPQVRCLYRPSSDRSVLAQPDIEWVSGDVSNPDALSTAMHRMDALINVVSLGLGHADVIIRAAQNAGIKRCIFISTTAIFTQLDAKSKSIRQNAECAIQSSGLDYTILRPTMIYGSPRDRNMWRLIQLMRSSPVIPVFGDGNSLQQPIYVDDVARAVLSCLKSEKTIRNSYNIAGKHPLTYNQVIDTISVCMQKHIRKVYIPYASVAALLKFFERLHLPVPIKAEQVLRLHENKSFEYTQASRDFGFAPLSFAEGIKRELATS